MSGLALKVQCGKSPAERNKGRKQSEEKTGALLEQGEQGKREDQTAERDGAAKTFKTKMRHLK